MATQNYFENNGVNVGLKTAPGSNAHEVIRFSGVASVLAADDDGSTYKLALSVPSSFVPTLATLQTTAITGGTDFDIGVFDPETGDAVDADLFVDGQTLASASKTLDGLSAVSVADLGGLKSIAELLGLTPSTAKAAYDIVLTANTAGSADGTARYLLEGIAA